MSILVFGAGGFLGGHFVGSLKQCTGSLTDIANESAVARELDQRQPQVVINCAGKTGRPNVDWCESHKLETVRANITGPLLLFEQCSKREIFFVHISSGCLYAGDNGGNGFSETDPPNFTGSFYVRTKLAIEQILAEFPCLILRPRMLFDGSHSDRNLLKKLGRYRRLLDEPNSLTCATDLVVAAQALIKQRECGIFNVVNSGTISPFEIMQEYKRRVDFNHTFTKLSTDGLGDVASTGRSNCVLSIKKLEKHGITMRPVRDALAEAFESLRQSSQSESR